MAEFEVWRKSVKKVNGVRRLGSILALGALACAGLFAQMKAVVLGMRRFTDTEFGFSFWYPADWKASMVKHLVWAIFLEAFIIVPPSRAQAPAVSAPTQSEQLKAESQQVELEKLRLETESLRREAQYAPLKTILAWTSITQSAATVLSLIIGGWWVYSKFVRAQEKYPNIEFSADINPVGLQNGVLIVELIAYIENKGKAQHKMNGLAFDLNALTPSDPIVSDERWGGQINFPFDVCRGSFLPARSEFFFVDPGTKAKYSFVAAVPENTTFLLLHTYFKYVGRGKTGHTAEKTLRIQAQALGISGQVAVASTDNDTQPS